MARAGGFFYGSGGVIALVLTLLPHPADAQVGAIRAISATVLVAAVALLWAGERVPTVVYHVLNLLGTTLLAMVIWWSHGGELAVGLSTQFVFASMNGFVFFRLRTATAYQLYAGAVLAALCWPLHVLPAPVVIGDALVSLVVAVGAAWLVRVAGRAERDAVTGLPNRRGLERLLDDVILATARSRCPLSVAYLDLDNFRKVNDTHGRAAGDDVLRRASLAWDRDLPPDGLLAHYGGGRFVVVLPGIDSNAASSTVEAMRSALGDGLTASAGLTQWHSGDTTSLLLSRADTSLYRAKGAGRNRMDPQIGNGLLAEELRAAVHSGAVTVLFQPIVDLQTGVIIGVEALARWRQPERGLVQPDDFIPLAEESGVIIELGRHVLVEACTQAVRAGSPQR